MTTPITETPAIKVRPYTHKGKATALSKRDITRLAYTFYKYTGEAPKLRHIPHLSFTKKRVMDLFSTWNEMLVCAGIPLNRNPISEITCKKCKKVVPRQVKELKKNYKHRFCSSECNASYNTKGRKHTEETKKKISDSLKAHRLFLKK